MILLFGCGSASPEGNNTSSPSHQAFTRLLQKHVDDKGMVDYRGFAQDSTELNAYLEELEAAPPSSQWQKDEKLAYWINAYNAYTIQLILKNYPLKSIKDITKGPNVPFVNSPWDITFISIGGEELDLNNIEHSIIRKEFDEPRIHFALVCAAISCPPLRNEAYEAAKLDDQLHEQAKTFLSNPDKNKLEGDRLQISKIFSWYGGDFEQGVAAYIHSLYPNKANKDAEVDYMDYNWALNEQ
ncbi:MAG: DUF547 domain-containing protein [Cyclobacteriaceae bacterium]